MTAFPHRHLLMENTLRTLLGLCCLALGVMGLPALADEALAPSSVAPLALSSASALTPSEPQVLPALIGEYPTLDFIHNAPSIETVDLTTVDGDIWTRMRKGFGMQDLASPVVDERVNYYAARPQALRTMVERSRKYLYHIVTELEKRGMPTELALLPMVESAFNPMAFSSAKAAGLWQFIPSTGKDFQLTQNWWVDQRRDILASTSAALQYLQALYEMHGDWHLALASYNWGENAVARAVAANRAAGKPTDFNSLNMPAETRQYVPKLQALKQLIAKPEAFGVKLPDIPNQPYFVTVERREGMDLALAAKLAEMPLVDFRALNPAYNRPVMPGSHSTSLVLPVANARKFEDNLAQHNEPLLSWKTYSLPRAERIEQVARRLNVATETLRTANGLPASGRLAAGYTLLIPDSVSVVATEMALKVQEKPAANNKRIGKISGTVVTKARPVVRRASPSKQRR